LAKVILISVVRLVVIVAVSAAVGAGYVRARFPDFCWRCGPPLRLDLNISADDLLSAVNDAAQGGAPLVLIDARSAEEFAKGHIAANSILNVDGDKVKGAEAAAYIEKLQLVMGQQIVIYCTSRTCDLAEKTHAFMASLGFVDMKIYLDGWEGWEKAGYPTDQGPELVFGAPLSDYFAGDPALEGDSLMDDGSLSGDDLGAGTDSDGLEEGDGQ
jgi:rhodanese-related sulfurtransferase